MSDYSDLHPTGSFPPIYIKVKEEKKPPETFIKLRQGVASFKDIISNIEKTTLELTSTK